MERMEKQLTAVEWLVEQLFLNNEIFGVSKELFEQAKAMEKEQIKDAYWDGGQDIPLTEERCNHYYNETFKSE